MDASAAGVHTVDVPPRVALHVMSDVEATSVGKVGQSPPRRWELEDIFDAAPTTGDTTGGGTAEHHVSRPPRGGSLSSSSSSSTSAALIPSAPIAASRVRIPSKENLYGRRSAVHPQRTSPAVVDAAVAHDDGKARDRRTARESPRVARPHPTSSSSPPLPLPSLAQQYGVDDVLAPAPRRDGGREPNVIADIDGEPGVVADSLLRRMQSKEKEFDKKIHQIHHTFQNAGEQLVARDNIIVRLQDELAGLRAEAARLPKEYQAREEKLLLRVDTMMTELAAEQKRAHDARYAAEAEVQALRGSLHAAEQQLAQQQHLSDDLLRQLRASDKTLQEERQRFTAGLADSRAAYDAKLHELQRSFRTTEKQLAKSRSRLEEAERDRCQHQARLLEMEMNGRRQLSSEVGKTRELLADQEAMREEVEAVRLSMARLLSLMGEVPALADYLRWNELTSEFVFLGYPSRYFNTSHSGGGRRQTTSRSPGRRAGSRGASPSRRQRSPAAARLRRRRASASAGDDGSLNDGPEQSASFSYHQLDASVSGLSVGDTGIDDGIYGGVAASLSKNVWLNGRWAQEMMSIIAAENNFTRLKRIKLLEMEEAAQLSEQLPSARDVLACRQPEHHYWIPYAVFVEAQRFKNKYYPKLPAMSHFSPFLIQLNKIWRARLQDRLRVQQHTHHQQEQQKQLQQQHSHAYSRHGTVEKSRLSSRTRSRGSGATGEQRYSEASRLSSCGIGTPVTASPEALLSEWTRQEARVDEIHAEHHRLRREVRLHVSSQKALQLFRLYDELVHGAYQSLGEVLQLAEEMYDSVPAHHAQKSEEETRSAAAAATAGALREAQQQQHAVESGVVEELVASRDRLRRLLEHACERMCDIGDSLSTQMMSYYSDLHQLIRMLHQHLHQGRQRARQETHARTSHVQRQAAGSSASSSSTASATTAPWVGGGAGGAPLPVAELQRRLRELLHDQYSTERESTPAAEGVAGAASAAAVPEAVRSGAVLKLAASVLDFGDEVRREVSQATTALHAVAEQSMQEAELYDTE
ncbi:hypothetical protein NESM_000710300 [Novymonas esmeraldas]|uniref:Uncharacterized protein n=1 Tax=Novymonas esmeraldas TaxID=1808958 RepID=A0AAW0ETJ8_9TRYP